MSLKEDAARVAVLQALRDTIDAEYEAARRRVLDGLPAARAELSLKSRRVTLRAAHVLTLDGGEP